MRRANRPRWRNTRGTLPARRRRRRARRRDIKRGETYTPIVVEANAAQVGALSRLWAAVGALTLTLCAGVVATLSPHLFTALLAGMTSLGGFVAALALIMSARDEERVHQLASSMHEGVLLGNEDAREQQA